MANLNLPPHIDGHRQTLDPTDRRLVIIGANGAGKTRFTERLMADISPELPTFRLSALAALFPDQPGRESRQDHIDQLYGECVARSPFMRSDNATRFERVMSLMIYDELMNLLTFKLEGTHDRKPKRLPRSRLDLAIRTWQEIFPGNRILRESGKMIFATQEDDTYPAVRLSDGEKAVLYYIGAVLFAPEKAVIFVDNPGMFLHPSVTTAIWERIEALRPDCTWIYTTHDVDFLTTMAPTSRVVWVRRYDAIRQRWDYAVMTPGAGLSEEIYLTLVGARKPVLFIEGDAKHSIDAKLYPLIFQDYTVRSLGSCDKVVEAVRTFNDLNSLHHLDSYGIVDRDRRDTREVSYLRDKKIFVPDVAEIENILMLEEVIRTVASSHGRSEDKVFGAVKRAVLNLFRHDLHSQAMQHTRHRVKRLMEYRVDGRFNDINSFESHIRNIVYEIEPRKIYESLCSDFKRYLVQEDYDSVLRVYNQKSMVTQSNVAALCGLNSKDAYIHDIIRLLRDNGPEAERIRRAVTDCFGIDEHQASAPKPENPIIGND